MNTHPCPKCGVEMRRARWTFSVSGVMIEGLRCKPCNINLTQKAAQELVEAKHANVYESGDARTDQEAGQGQRDPVPGTGTIQDCGGDM